MYFASMLIFLDIDGVMVPAKGWKSPELLSDGFPAFSEKATAVLRSLVSEADTVILTSSHKSNYSVDEWKNIFKKRDINIENIQCLDQNIQNLSRKDEILRWFNATNSDNQFIIIDDDKSLNSLPDTLKRNLVLTSSYVGLSPQHLADIQAISGRQIHLA
jgi:hypothetical protein